jgi:hypothetical protein
MNTWGSCDFFEESVNQKVRWRKPRLPILSSLGAVLARLVQRIGSFRLRSRKLTLDIERKTARSDQDAHKETSLSLHIGSESGCEADAEDEESVHRTDHHRF